jgi:hypothetical protein
MEHAGMIINLSEQDNIKAELVQYGHKGVKAQRRNGATVQWYDGLKLYVKR